MTLITCDRRMGVNAAYEPLSLHAPRACEAPPAGPTWVCACCEHEQAPCRHSLLRMPSPTSPALPPLVCIVPAPRLTCRPTTAAGRLSTEGGARLARVEAAVEQQAGSLGAAMKKLDKLGMRVRVATSDLKQPISQVRPPAACGCGCGCLPRVCTPTCRCRRPPHTAPCMLHCTEHPAHSNKYPLPSCLAHLAPPLPHLQVQNAAAQHAELLVRLAEGQELLKKQVDDTQALLGALQGVSAKQFQVGGGRGG